MVILIASYLAAIGWASPWRPSR